MLNVRTNDFRMIFILDNTKCPSLRLRHKCRVTNLGVKELLGKVFGENLVSHQVATILLQNFHSFVFKKYYPLYACLICIGIIVNDVRRQQKNK